MIVSEGIPRAPHSLPASRGSQSRQCFPEQKHKCLAHLLLSAFVASSLNAGLAFLIMIMIAMIVVQRATGAAFMGDRTASFPLRTAIAMARTSWARWTQRCPSAGNNWRAVHAPAKGATASQPSQLTSNLKKAKGGRQSRSPKNVKCAPSGGVVSLAGIALRRQRM